MTATHAPAEAAAAGWTQKQPWLCGAGKYVIHFGSSPVEAAEQVATAVQAAHPDRPPPLVTALAQARTDVSVIPTSTGKSKLRGVVIGSGCLGF